MAKKKKKVINLAKEDISYTEDERTIKIIAFNPNSMEVDVSILEKDKTKRVMKLPFAHLPKEIKKLVRPI